MLAARPPAVDLPSRGTPLASRREPRVETCVCRVDRLSAAWALWRRLFLHSCPAQLGAARRDVKATAGPKEI
jgi:hypothetical protein